MAITRKKVIAVTIFSLVVLFIIFLAGRVVVNALQGETNLDLVEFVTKPCQEIPMQVTNRMAVLRIDDIQADWYSEIGRRMIRDAQARGVVPVLGVIPKNLEKDPITYDFLREVRCNFEVALHGWDHQNELDPALGEFANVTYDEASELVDQGRPILEILTRKKIRTFIPPQNEISVAGDKLMTDVKLMVSEDEGEVLDITSSTYNFKTKTEVPAEQMVRDCNIQWNSNPLCVIMTHPQDLVTNNVLDENKYKEYLEVIDSLIAGGANFVTFEFLKDREWSGLPK